MTPENPTYTLVESHLKSWKNTSQVTTQYLDSADGHRLPFIHFSSAQPHSPTIVFTSGFHLDEPDGPIALSNSKNFIDQYLVLTQRFNLDIYPLINQTAQSLPPDRFHPNLRHNPQGINYNNGWGTQPKSAEVAAIQEHIWQTHQKNRVVLAVSFHQDSTVKGGYAWLNNLKPTLVDQIGDWSSRLIPRETRLCHPHPQAQPFRFPHIIPDVDDLGTFETWIQYKLHAPVFCLEAPTPPAPFDESLFFYRQWLTIISSLPQIR